MIDTRTQDHGTIWESMDRKNFAYCGINRVKRAMRELRKMSDQSNAETGPVTWTREDVHER